MKPSSFRKAERSAALRSPVQVMLDVAECLSTVYPTPVRSIERDSRCSFEMVCATIDWLIDNGIGAYLSDNYVFVHERNRDLLDLFCTRGRVIENYRQRRQALARRKRPSR